MRGIEPNSTQPTASRTLLPGLGDSGTDRERLAERGTWIRTTSYCQLERYLFTVVRLPTTDRFFVFFWKGKNCCPGVARLPTDRYGGGGGGAVAVGCTYSLELEGVTVVVPRLLLFLSVGGVFCSWVIVAVSCSGE